MSEPSQGGEATDATLLDATSGSTSEDGPTDFAHRTEGATNDIQAPIIIYVQTMINNEMLASPEGNYTLTFDAPPSILDIINKWKTTAAESGNPKFCDVDFRLPMVYPYSNEKATILLPTDMWNNKLGGNDAKCPLTVKVSASKGLGGELEPIARCGKALLKSISAPDAFQDIGDGMILMAPMMNMESLCECDAVVVRGIDQKFWNACIKKCHDETTEYHVCAVGTPGIGKTVTTPVLLRLLMEEGTTIVYHCRAPISERGVMLEFVPCGRDSNMAYKYHCFAYWETEEDLTEIASLWARSTFYIVDPCKSTSSCNPSDSFCPKVIIVAAPDDMHWGPGFLKNNNNRMGTFLYYPLWTLQELLQAREALNARFNYVTLSEQDLRIRFFKVGGVPRTLFLPESDFDNAVNLQEQALGDLRPHQLDDLVVNPEGSLYFSPNQANSALLGYQQTEDETFETDSVGIVSSLARAKIYNHFKDRVWNMLCTVAEVMMRWKIFEDYVTLQMVGTECTYHNWKLLGQGKPQMSLLSLGGCEYLATVDDIISNALATPNVVFCPHDKQYPFVDFVYSKDVADERVVYFFQATIGEKQKFDTARIKKWEKKNCGPVKFVLHYMVIPSRFDNFVLTFQQGQGLATKNTEMNQYIRIVKVIGPEREPIFATIANEATPVVRPRNHTGRAAGNMRRSVSKSVDKKRKPNQS